MIFGFSFVALQGLIRLTVKATFPLSTVKSKFKPISFSLSHVIRESSLLAFGILLFRYLALQNLTLSILIYYFIIHKISSILFFSQFYLNNIIFILPLSLFPPLSSQWIATVSHHHHKPSTFNSKPRPTANLLPPQLASIQKSIP